MWKNYIKTALRNIKKQKLFSFINISGLAIAMTACFLISLWIEHEISYDKFHEKADDIYVVATHEKLESGQRTLSTQCSPMGPMLTEAIPEILDYNRIYRLSCSVSNGAETFSEYICLSDPSILDIFSFNLVQGTSECLTDPHSIVLTESAAKKYFGDDNPVGQSLSLDDKMQFNVSAVMKDIPQNSTLSFEVLIPLNILNEFGYNLEEWAGSDYYTCILLENNSDIRLVEQKIGSLTNEMFTQLTGQDESPYMMFLHPMTSWHLHSLDGNEKIQYVYILLIVGIIILLIACANYINLSTARSITRAKEIGLRKVVGAQKANLVNQLLSESIIMSILAAFISVVLTECALPVFNNLSGVNLSVSYTNIGFIGLMVAFVLITGFLAGSFPAFYLASMQPSKTIKNQLTFGRKSIWFRRVLVVTQFSLSIVLIIYTLIIYDQLHFLKDKDIGLNRDNVLVFYPSQNISNQYDVFRDELMKDSHVYNVAASAQNIAHVNSTLGRNVDWEGKDNTQQLEIHFDWVSYDFAQTLGIEIAEGRFYSREFASDMTDGIVLNEKAIELMGIKSPIGKRFSYWGNEKTIIGVVKDFHLEPLNETLKPLALIYGSTNSIMYISISPDDNPATISNIEKVHNKFEPNSDFRYSMLADTYNYLYRTENRLSDIYRYAAMVAILIACLGLFGLASFTTERRIKEIGVRKVLGASVFSIFKLVSKEFLVLVLFANLLAWPITYYAASRWLENFAYRVSIEGWIFLLAAGLASFLALFTVGYLVIKASFTNPVESLHHE